MIPKRDFVVVERLGICPSLLGKDTYVYKTKHKTKINIKQNQFWRATSLKKSKYDAQVRRTLMVKLARFWRNIYIMNVPSFDKICAPKDTNKLKVEKQTLKSLLTVDNQIK